MSPLQFELAVGKFPYPFPKDVDIFKQLELVVEGRPPRVPDSVPISVELRDFIHRWCISNTQFPFHHLSLSLSLSLAHSLTKEVSNRPKFHQLLDDPFIKRTEAESIDIGPWFRDILEREHSSASH